MRSRQVRLVPTEHPRVCGENRIDKVSIINGEGTSPRMRGKQNPLDEWILTQRNIPAYAGKTIGGGRVTSPRGEHPRVCGENVDVDMVILDLRGTSPRMRGKLSLTQHPKGWIRNIPAYAGKTDRIHGASPER